jgi:hypothetical protein
MKDAVFFEGGGFRVTATLLTTPRKTYKLRQIEYVAVSRPLLLFLAPPAALTAVFVIAFRRYLYAGEIMTVIGCAVAALAFALLFGTLRVHSLALRGDDVGLTFGFVYRLRQVRRAVEMAMLSGREDTQ